MKTKPIVSEHAQNLYNKRLRGKQKGSLNEMLKDVSTRLCLGYPEPTRTARSRLYNRLMSSGTFLPTTATLHNVVHGSGSLAGCTVLPVEDGARGFLVTTLPQVLESLLEGVGVGLDLSALAPRHAPDLSTGRSSPGPVESLSSLSLAADRPIAHAGLKPAALMASLRADHPDVFEFIRLKIGRRIASVNLSLAIDSPFVEAAEREGLLPARWGAGAGLVPLTRQALTDWHERSSQRACGSVDLSIISKDQVHSRAVDNVVGRVVGDIVCLWAKSILEEVARASHACGDPGLINLEAINRSNPTHPRDRGRGVSTWGVGVIRTTTPCGEQPLLPFEKCYLGSLNLATFVDRKTRMFRFDRLARATELSVRLLDDVIELDLGSDDRSESAKVIRANRKIGVGMMGLADALAELELPYDSPRARQFASQVASAIQAAAENASRTLAREREPFGNWEDSSFARGKLPPRRHATVTTIAPTGHISTLADCSTGVEPYFRLAYLRDAAGSRFQRCASLGRKLQSLGYDLDTWIAATRTRDPEFRFEGTLKGLCEAPTGDAQRDGRLRDLKGVFRTAHEITPADHLAMIRAIQDHVENGVSKTVNLPHDAGIGDVVAILKDALRLGLKGITVFRDGCLSHQALSGAPACPACGKVEALRPNDCHEWKCDPIFGGCGHDACSV